MGGGSAGCVLANRLSADGQYTVLLLEAGGEETQDPLIDVPMACGAVMSSKNLLWDDWTDKQVCNVGYDNQVSFVSPESQTWDNSATHYKTFRFTSDSSYLLWCEKSLLVVRHAMIFPHMMFITDHQHTVCYIFKILHSIGVISECDTKTSLQLEKRYSFR